MDVDAGTSNEVQSVTTDPNQARATYETPVLEQHGTWTVNLGSECVDCP